MKYIVLKDFLDRFDNLRHCKPGEIHVPPNEERAKQLIDGGFIVSLPSDEEKSNEQTDEKPKARGRRKTKSNDLEQQEDVVKDGDNDDEQTDQSKEV